MKIETVEIKKFIANDWTEFQTEEWCIEYEKSVQEEWIEHDCYLHAEKWGIAEELQNEIWIQFDEYNDDLQWNLKYILNEICVRIKLSTKTWEYEIISVDERKEISLVWAYKDCVLAWWQDKEDSKRDEIFYNETLWSDQIDRLLDPKIFTGFKRIGRDGKYDLEEFRKDENGNIKDNLIIKWNNLLALHSLKQQFKGKVKLIYIDPPYNTWSDGFRYNDRFNHSSWLTFMKNRLEVAKELLREDGVIFVQCDYRENAYLRILMDGIFSPDNFVNEICWKKYSWVKNQASNKLTTQQETILVFSRSDQFQPNWVYNSLSEKYVKDEYKYLDENGRRYAKLRWRGYQDGNSTTKIKYLDENPWSPITTLWSEDFLQLSTSSNEKLKDFIWQKPEALLQRILHLWTNKNDIVLDFFWWTGTTGAVAHKMERQYILIEQMDYIHDYPEQRLINVINWDTTGISDSVGWKWGWDFVYMEIACDAENYIQIIRLARDTESLLEIWEEIKTKSWVNHKLDPKSIDNTLETFKALAFSDQQKTLIELIDKNALYKNLSEMDDTTSEVSESDKKLNRDFYNQ